jgi:CheY-like chemotaxis protein/GAF domain-containing protein
MPTILIVDDNEVDRKLLVAQLHAGGHRVLEAGDSFEGLRLARTQQPQLIISDVLMPTMDGYGFVRALRAEAHLRAIPVIFHTAHYQELEARKLARACNVEILLAKPCLAADVYAAIERAMAEVSEVDSDRDPPPADFDREHLRLVTNKLLDRAEAYTAFESSFETLADAALELAAMADPHALLARACNDARTLFGAAYAVIAVTDKTSGSGVFFATSGIDFGASSLEAPTLDAGPLGSLLTSRLPWRASQKEGRSIDGGLPAGYPKAQAFLAVPLMTPSRVYGWLCLADKIGAAEFVQQDEKLLNLLATLVGRTYENLNLHLALKWQEKKTARTKPLLPSGLESKVLERVYALLGGTHELTVRSRSRDELCKEACRLAVRQGHFELAYIELQNAGSPNMKLVAAAGGPRDSVEVARGLSNATAEQDDLLNEVFRTHQPAVRNDLQDHHSGVRLRSDLLDRGYRSMAALPIGTDGVSVGRLVVLSDRPEFFDAAELRLLTEVTGYISRSIALRAAASLRPEVKLHGHPAR